MHKFLKKNKDDSAHRIGVSVPERASASECWRVGGEVEEAGTQNVNGSTPHIFARSPGLLRGHVFIPEPS